jgi:hypothetical protein
MTAQQLIIKSTITDVMEVWSCSELEAYASFVFNTNSLEETRRAIAKAVTYERLLSSLLPEKLYYLRNEHYKDKNVTEEDIQAEAQAMAEEQAEMFDYSWGQVDDYDTMTEAEKEAALYGD